MASRPAPLNGASAEERREIAAYLASMSRDLGVMARRNGLITLAYLLDVAYLEADSAARSGSGDAPSPLVDRP